MILSNGVFFVFCGVTWYFDAPFYKYSECSSSGGNEILEKVWWFLHFLYEKDRRVKGGSWWNGISGVRFMWN